MMDIISDWQVPLEDSLEELLKSRDLSFSNLEEIRRSLSLMDNRSERISGLVGLLDQRVQQMDQEYRKTVLEGNQNLLRTMVGATVSRLEQLPVYRDAAEKLRQGKEIIQQGKERLPQEAQQLKERLQEKTSSLLKSTADGLKSFRSRFRKSE